MTVSMLVPVAQRSGAPVLLINLQPTEEMDHATFDTGAWPGTGHRAAELKAVAELVGLESVEVRVR
jgi:hypothetical protein